MLTDAQELQINSVDKYTHDYEAEAVKSFDATGDDKMEELQARFEADIAGAYDNEDDMGGIVAYFKDSELVAFYDYENFKGAVFELAAA
jgi:hypothetical protein|tara:strand:- start:163 stop:429 length:267 start_codon:yes stop_codon:yes gene_type:complete